MSFEDELGAALRRAGDGFTPDRPSLVDAGELRGRRLLARRRATLTGGSVLALALVALAGAWSGGLLGGPVAGAAAAGPPTPAAGRSGSGAGDGGEKTVPTGTGAVGADLMVAKLRALLPGGSLGDTTARGTEHELGPLVHAVYDDGKGAAALSLVLARVDPQGATARDQTGCGDKELQNYDDCRTEQLADGSRLMLYQGYEYPDRRADTRTWRAVLVTPQGFMVSAAEWNSPAEKGAPVTRAVPPLTTAQLKDLVTSPTWLPALNDLPPAAPEEPHPGEGTPGRPAGPVLVGLLAGYGIPVASSGGEDDYGYAVLDDGRGRSLVQVNAERAGPGTELTGDEVITLPDGTRMRIRQGPGEKDPGVVRWTVETRRANGVRVTVSAFGAAGQYGPATRTAPALTVEQLKELALAPDWSRR
ncbi:hypothetical protein AB0O18_25905 [Streptomyces sp. NPDC093224]|uniref:hypothetical protein n=1 Tax=Streptomyces sp. NPDC093224 TaxID=3155198 RepID=UPI00342999E3